MTLRAVVQLAGFILLMLAGFRIFRDFLKRRGKRMAAAGAIGILATAYVLSIGPAASLAQVFQGPPQVIEAYRQVYAPMARCVAHGSPAHLILNQYVSFWIYEEYR